jgi:hypothetical protein
MTSFVRISLISSLLMLQMACTQAGEPLATPPASSSKPGSVMCDPLKDPNCGPIGTSRPPIQPAVPPIPQSPLRLDCERLPTQVERDTCTNRKESTG